MQFKLRALLAVALVSAFVFAPPAVPVQAKPPVSLANGRAEEVGMSTQRLEKITSAFTKEINDKKLPGAVVIVARKDLSFIRTRSVYGIQRNPIRWA